MPWNKYTAFLDSHPVTTKCITAAFLSSVADIIVQMLAGVSILNLMMGTIIIQFTIGLIFRGPVSHYWFVTLEKLFERLGLGTKDDSSRFSTVLAKVAVDQIFCSPLVNLSYYYVLGVLEGRHLRYIHDNIIMTFGGVMLLNYMIWPFVNFLTFFKVPLNLRVLWVNVVGVVWTVILILFTS